MCIAVLRCPDGSPQQLQIAVFSVNRGGRNKRAVELGVVSRSGDYFALVRVELEPDFSGSLFEAVESFGDSALFPG